MKVLFQVPDQEEQMEKNILHSIILPIPPNIQDGNAVSYSDSSMNALTAAVTGGCTDIMTELPKLFWSERKLEHTQR